MTEPIYCVEFIDRNRSSYDDSSESTLYEDARDAVNYVIDEHMHYWGSCLDNNITCDKVGCKIKELATFERVKEYLLQELVDNSYTTYPLYNSCISDCMALFKITTSQIVPSSYKKKIELAKNE